MKKLNDAVDAAHKHMVQCAKEYNDVLQRAPATANGTNPSLSDWRKQRDVAHERLYQASMQFNTAATNHKLGHDDLMEQTEIRGGWNGNALSLSADQQSVADEAGRQAEQWKRDQLKARGIDPDQYPRPQTTAHCI